MNLPDVRSALGVGDRQWQECAPTPHMLLTNDWMQARDAPSPACICEKQRKECIIARRG